MKNREFNYIEDDVEGEATLDSVSGAANFNSWMYKTITPYCHGNILEVGSGIGNISEYFLNDGKKLHLSDIREGYCDKLREKFLGNTHVLGVTKIDLVHPNFDEEYSFLLETFDSIYALNVVEHIKDDAQAIANCKKLLKKGGNLVILVPAFEFLYNTFDEALYHYRRYTKSNLENLIIKKNKFTLVKSMYFNVFGMLGWFVTGGIMKKRVIPTGQMGFYNKLVPFIKLIDSIVFKSFGLSVIVIGKK